jgi:hypothetical protein
MRDNASSQGVFNKFSQVLQGWLWKVTHPKEEDLGSPTISCSLNFTLLAGHQTITHSVAKIGWPCVIIHSFPSTASTLLE